MQASSEGKFTPLAQALMCRDLEKMKALLEDGADPNERLPRGQSLVWLAATYSDPRFLPLLVSHGGNLEGHEDRIETSALAGGMTAGFQLDVWDNYYFALDAGGPEHPLRQPAVGDSGGEGHWIGFLRQGA